MISQVTAAFLLISYPASNRGMIDTITPVASPDFDQSMLALNDIDATFNDCSDRALLYAGSPAADPQVIRRMRELYSKALDSVRTLKRNKRGPDYQDARKSVEEFVTYVNRHPPGIIAPPVMSASD